MKNILILLSLFLFACGPSREELESQERARVAALAQKYHEGEIVYLKPDSSKAVIINAIVSFKDECSCGPETNKAFMKYEVRDNHGNVNIVPESLIYPPLEPTL